jgi:hypothetical protein
MPGKLNQGLRTEHGCCMMCMSMDMCDVPQAPAQYPGLMGRTWCLGGCCRGCRWCQPLHRCVGRLVQEAEGVASLHKGLQNSYPHKS